jgi:hypothetical protein
MFLPNYDGGASRLPPVVPTRWDARRVDQPVLRVVIRSLGLPQHPDARGPKDPILLAVDSVFRLPRAIAEWVVWATL